MILRVRVGEHQDDHKLHDTGQDRGPGRAHHPQPRRAEAAVDQDPVADEVHQHGRDARAHGEGGAGGLPQGGGVGLGQGPHGQADQRHGQIRPGALERQHQIPLLAPLMEEEGEEGFVEEVQGQHAQNGQEPHQPELEPEHVLHAGQVPLAVELGPVDARAAEAAEHTQVEHEDQLVADGHAGHLLRADAAHHEIVQHVHEAGDTVLNHHRQGDSQHQPIERPIPDILFFKSFPHHCTASYPISPRFAI